MSREEVQKWREIEDYEEELFDLYISSDSEVDEVEADPNTASNLHRLNEDVVALNEKLRALEEETKLKGKCIEDLNESLKLGESQKSGLD